MMGMTIAAHHRFVVLICCEMLTDQRPVSGDRWSVDQFTSWCHLPVINCLCLMWVNFIYGQLVIYIYAANGVRSSHGTQLQNNISDFIHIFLLAVSFLVPEVIVVVRNRCLPETWQHWQDTSDSPETAGTKLLLMSTANSSNCAKYSNEWWKWVYQIL